MISIAAGCIYADTKSFGEAELTNKQAKYLWELFNRHCA